MPGVRRGLRRALDRDRSIALGGDTSAYVSDACLHRSDSMSRGDQRAPPISRIQASPRNNQEEDDMLKDSKAFSGFSAGDIPKAK